MVIATGGWHNAFWPNTGMRDLSGEGIAMAHRAGAEIGNMEFITFCCNILLWPPLWRGSLATYILSLRIDAELSNSAGEVFLKKYDPFVVKWGTYMEWNKGFVSFASMREIRDGKGSPHGGIYFGLGSTPYETFEKIALGRFPKWKYKALDLSEMPHIIKAGKPLEVGPVVEYFDGGIVVNEKFETPVEGLYAAGECLSVNQRLKDQPALISRAPQEDGFLLTLKPKNLQRDQKNFFSGEGALSWYRKEWERFKAEVISELPIRQKWLGMTMQDGEITLRDIKQLIGLQRYIRLVNTFLRKGEKASLDPKA